MEQVNGEVKQLVEIPPDPRDGYIVRIDRKLQLMRKELEQYRQDLVFWKTAHASEYPLRRIEELDKKLAEIDLI
jgi:hypothetical protein